MKYILSIDQGTTSSRAILFDESMHVAAVSQKEITQYFPKSGWVEHDPNEIWETTIYVCRDVLKKIVTTDSIVSIGITNQRETTVIWDRKTGEPVHNAIVWQDRRTADICNTLKADGLEGKITEKTGLLLDPYFSATKVKWLLDHVDGVRQRANAGELLFGTIDSFLLWRLTGGVAHQTDATNAARTMLYNIGEGRWDKDICKMLDIPMQMLPEVRDCAADFGVTEPSLFGSAIPICGMAGDQQAATIGQACFAPGMMKATYGTGCFALLNTGTELVRSKNRLLGTIAYQLDGQITYALEGSIFVAGAVVQWLRDGLGIIENAAETQSLAAAADKEQDVYMVPAFTGLGAPYWDAECRGAIFGLTRNSGPRELAKAALESVGYQTRDLLEAMREDWAGESNVLRVDGGMSGSDWTMQFLADMIGAPVDRPELLETTAMGVAWLAGMHMEFYPDQDECAKNWQSDRRFLPVMKDEERERKYRGWQDAVSRTLSDYSSTTG